VCTCGIPVESPLFVCVSVPPSSLPTALLSERTILFLSAPFSLPSNSLDEEHCARGLSPAHSPQVDAHTVLDRLVHAHEGDLLACYPPRLARAGVHVIQGTVFERNPFLVAPLALFRGAWRTVFRREGVAGSWFTVGRALPEVDP
jgi:hypothetical protein